MFYPQISLGNAVLNKVKQNFFLVARFLRAFKILICVVTIQEVIIIWETLKEMPDIGSLSQVTFLVAYLILGKIYDSFRKTLRIDLMF